MKVEHDKRLACRAAAELVEDGMLVGLETGSTADYRPPVLAVRGRELRLRRHPRPRPSARHASPGSTPTRFAATPLSDSSRSRSTARTRAPHLARGQHNTIVATLLLLVFHVVLIGIGISGLA